MPKLKNRVPSYRKHKASGQAVVTLNGRTFYLGKYNSAASRGEYNRLIAEWMAEGGNFQSSPSSDYTVAELLAAFLKHAKGYYRNPDGSQTAEFEKFKYAARPLKALYGRTSVKDFGPLALKAVRQEFIKGGASRNYCNQSANKIRHIFKWGVGNELVPPSVLHGLQAVAPLKRGRTEARETDAVKPVPDAFVDAVLPYVSRQVAAMIQLQRITGARSGELAIMRGCDLDVSGNVWVFTPHDHKTAHHGHKRSIYLGPQAQQIVREFLKTDTQAYLFSPADAEAERREEQSRRRKTPLSCGNRPGSNRKTKPSRQPRERYGTDSYRRAIRRGIDAANQALLDDAKDQGMKADEVALIPNWHPHQLRHNAATSLRKQYGIEVARIILGHRSAAITEVYAEVDHARAIDVMGQVG